MAHDLFVSYSSKDRDRVRRWVQQLSSFGVECWMDEGGIDGAMLYGEEIVVALRSSSVVLLFLSRASVLSHNVIKEVTLAAESRKPILPFFLEDVDVPPALEYQLAGVQRIAAAGRPESLVLADVVRALSRLGIPVVGQPGRTTSAPTVEASAPASGGPVGGTRRGVLAGAAILAVVVALVLTGWALLRSDIRAPAVPTPPVASLPEPGIEPGGRVAAASGCGGWCPPAYELLYPFLEAVCAGTFGTQEMSRLQTLVSNGQLSRPDIEALYNAYGAKWRYEFHKLKHLNGFFYDPGAASWLPPSCPASLGSVRGLGALPAAEQRWMGAIKALR